MLSDEVIEIISSAEKTHRGLGLPLLLTHIINMINWGCIWLGLRGVGKSTVVESVALKRNQVQIPALSLNKKMFLASIVRIADEVEEIEEASAVIIKFKQKEIVFKLSELSAMESWGRDLALSLASQLITNDTFDYPVYSHILRFEKCRASCFIAVQPEVLNYYLARNVKFTSFFTDRLLKLALWNPLRKGRSELRPRLRLPDVYYDYRVPLVDEIRRRLRLTSLGRSYLERLRELIFSQQINRYDLVSLRMLHAFAALKRNEENPEIHDNDVIELYFILYPYASPVSKAFYREDVDKPLKLEMKGLILALAAAEFSAKKQCEITFKQLEKILRVRAELIAKAIARARELGVDVLRYRLAGRRAYLSIADRYAQFFAAYRTIVETLIGA